MPALLYSEFSTALRTLNPSTPAAPLCEYYCVLGPYCTEHEYFIAVTGRACQQNLPPASPSSSRPARAVQRERSMPSSPPILPSPGPLLW